MIRLALLRHGHTSWNRAGRIQGRTDVPLDSAAQEHLSALRLPTPWDQADLVSSPLSRAIHTANLISGRAPQTDPALTEMDWGDWEGQHGEDLLAQPGSGYRHIENWGWEFRPPGGESPRNVLERLIPWVRTLKSDTVAVSHIGIMRMLLAKATGWDFEGPPPFRIKRDRLFVLAIEGD
ncbi:MAG: histidine phosphatase family protein, partial [Paracoccaceae bacterium]